MSGFMYILTIIAMSLQYPQLSLYATTIYCLNESLLFFYRHKFNTLDIPRQKNLINPINFSQDPF